MYTSENNVSEATVVTAVGLVIEHRENGIYMHFDWKLHGEIRCEFGHQGITVIKNLRRGKWLVEVPCACASCLQSFLSHCGPRPLIACEKRNMYDKWPNLFGRELHNSLVFVVVLNITSLHN